MAGRGPFFQNPADIFSTDTQKKGQDDRVGPVPNHP